MATTNGRTVAEVRNWPVNPIAHRALTDYLSALPADPATESSPSTLLSGSRLDFTGADLSGLDLLGAELSEAILTDVKLIGSDLYTAWLTAAGISRADLSRADLRKVQGRGCHAQQAVFRGADLQRAEARFDAAEYALSAVTVSGLRRGGPPPRRVLGGISSDAGTFVIRAAVWRVVLISFAVGVLVRVPIG